MIIRTVKFSLLLFFALAFSASAYSNPGNPTGFVNDYAGILNTEQRQTLEGKLSQYEKDSSNEISVVTIKKLDGDTIENFAEKLFKDWGIGKKGKDNGILILVALEDRKMRIEVGYGLEEKVTDAQASWIINNVMKPSFQASNYYQGIDGAVSKIIAAIEGENVILEDAKQKVKMQEIEKQIRENQPIENYSGTSASLGMKEKILASLVVGVPLLAVLGMAFFAIFGIIRIILGTLGQSKSWVAGGICGGLIGASVGILSQNLDTGFFWTSILAAGGFFLDYILSQHTQFWKKDLKEFTKKKPGSGTGFWSGGGGFGGSGGGGGFGGFGGGGSGGGGASGGW